MRPPSRSSEAAPAIVALLLAGGCAQTPISTDLVSSFRSPNFDALAIRRVVVVPFDCYVGDLKAVSTVTGAFAQKLQELGRFEVIYQPDMLKDIDEEAKLWQRGQINLAVLAKASEEYQADAFVFGTITRYHPYDPPVLGLKVGFAAAGNGQFIWQADGVFDAKTARVADAVKDYYKKRYERENYFYGWRVMLVTMERYAEFVCDAIVDSLRRGGQRAD